MKTINIKEYKIIHDVPPPLQVADRVAIDTEFVGMDKSRLHRPTGEFACATFYFGTDEVYIVENVNDLPQAFENVEKAGWIFHNAKFDIFHLRRYTVIPVRMKMWDTMLVEQVMYSGLYTEFNLAACVRRHLDMYMPKDVRDEFSTHSGEMSKEQVEYACIDTIATYQLFQDQRAHIDADDLKVWKDIELPFLWTLLSIGGITLDKKCWLSIAEENGAKADALQGKYGKKVQKVSEKTGKPLKSFTFDGINLASPAQVKRHIQSLGINVESTGEEILEAYADKVEFIRDLLDYRNASKRAGTYGADYIEKYVEADGRIYTDFFQMGAQTGRLSSRSPNLQNQPRDGGYRGCYVASEGHQLVIADWSSQEPKFAAYITGDTNLVDALNSGEKLYIRIARDALGIEVKKGEEAYNHMKSTILGLFYGMSAKGLADRIGKSEEEAQGMIDAILRAYPKVGEWIRRSQSHFVPCVTSVSGRKVWLNEYTNAWRRAALNYPIQSSAADAMKIASYRIARDYHGTFYTNSLIRLFVHDEVVVEVPDKDVELVSKLLERVMVEAAESLHPGVRGGAELYSGHTWAEKH